MSVKAEIAIGQNGPLLQGSDFIRKPHNPRANREAIWRVSPDAGADWTADGKVARCDKMRKKAGAPVFRGSHKRPAAVPFDEDVQASRVMTAGLWQSSHPLRRQPRGALQQAMTSAGCLAICPIAILSRLDEAQLRFPLIHT
ncbi:hypothetical protein [Xanthomonas arboricola]|uniref:hypothetical protein n=1 Tax=Xanthomonas arboricola TaxID=56448 RepID=UPI0011B040C8|nr:hypothetical protein [Xanthomonas arboricola]